MRKLHKKARLLFDRMTPRKRANALAISLADRELMRKRIEQEEHQEMLRIEAKRKDIMRIVMSAKTPPTTTETVKYFVLDEDGGVKQSLEMTRRAQ